MYGNLEYGILPYGDAVRWSTVIVVDKRDIEVIFMSLKKTSVFKSIDVQSFFFNAPYKTDLFIASDKLSAFMSLSKINIFKSEDN